jgi:hypothetical protein
MIDFEKNKDFLDEITNFQFLFVHFYNQHLNLHLKYLL